MGKKLLRDRTKSAQNTKKVEGAVGFIVPSVEIPKVTIEARLAAQAHSRIGRSTEPLPLREGNSLGVFVRLLFLLVSQHEENVLMLP